MTYTYNGKKIKLHGIFQRAQVLEPSILIGGHSGGQLSSPIAVVEYENGDFDEIPPHLIKGVVK